MVFKNSFVKAEAELWYSGATEFFTIASSISPAISVQRSFPFIETTAAMIEPESEGVR